MQHQLDQGSVLFYSVSMLLEETCIFQKLSLLEPSIEAAYQGQLLVPEIPGRDIEYLPISFLKGRIGLSQNIGQIKLLHDLANIELQAMELGLRSLSEFHWYEDDFKEQLIKIIKEEASHLSLCLKAIESLGGQWGQFPVHLGLWHATHKKDSLLERLFIVHRYLEGSGLDAGDTLLRRLSGVENKALKQVVRTIVEEEVSHVNFGSRWFNKLADQLMIDKAEFFERTCSRLMKKHPRKDKISESYRRSAGFSEPEIQYLQRLRLA